MIKKIFLFVIVFFVASSALFSAENKRRRRKITVPWTQTFGNNLVFGIPDENDFILHKEGFSIGYSTKYRQAVWVCYMLFADNLKAKQVKRSNNFKADNAVPNPIYPNDYNKSGYDRGHLAPAADMTYSLESMENSFFMTNISPQIPGCNRGIWRRVETQVRTWAYQEEILYVITGPIFDEKNEKKLGATDIPVPVAFYKIIFDLTPPCKMIGFIVPNETTKRRVPSFVVSVDDIEKLTGNDFFNNLPKKDEAIFEAQKDINLWNNPGPRRK